MSPDLITRWPVQSLVVAALVLVCTLYSTWRLLPVGRRLRLVEWLLPAAQRTGSGWPAQLHASLRSRALKACGGGCCGSDGVSARPGAPARTRSAGAPRR